MLNQYLVLSSFKMVKTAIDPKLIVRNSAVRAAIPILPMPLATLCFVLNLLVPGFGKLVISWVPKWYEKWYETRYWFDSSYWYFIICCIHVRTRVHPTKIVESKLIKIAYFWEIWLKNGLNLNLDLTENSDFSLSKYRARKRILSAHIVRIYLKKMEQNVFKSKFSVANFSIFDLSNFKWNTLYQVCKRHYQLFRSYLKPWDLQNPIIHISLQMIIFEITPTITSCPMRMLSKKISHSVLILFSI